MVNARRTAVNLCGVFRAWFGSHIPARAGNLALATLDDDLRKAAKRLGVPS